MAEGQEGSANPLKDRYPRHSNLEIAGEGRFSFAESRALSGAVGRAGRGWDPW